MSIQNNITILPISGYSPNFTWQVGYNTNDIPTNNVLTFRATVRALNGMESLGRIPNGIFLYQETGIIIDDATNQGRWTFPLEINASLSGGPYRDFQVVIEAHDEFGNTSAGNSIGTNYDIGWPAYSQGYDVIAVSNPRQTGIELGYNIPTRYTVISGFGNTGFILNSGNGYNSLNYMGNHGEINIRYLNGDFDSNLVGGYLYVWTGAFPKREAALSVVQNVTGFNGIIRSPFTFNPIDGYVYNQAAAMSFRGANQVYVSISFYDNLDQIAIDNGIEIGTGLYISDNAICYNDIAAGSISIGGFQTIMSMQYTGNRPPTGILGTGATILANQFKNGVSSVLYMSSPSILTGFNSYSGTNNMVAGGAGGGAILLNNNPISSTIINFNVKIGSTTDDSMAIYLNGLPIKDDNIGYPSDALTFDLINLAALSGYTLKLGDTISFASKDVNGINWGTQAWTGNITFLDGHINSFTGGKTQAAPSTGIPPVYYYNGYLVVAR